MSPLAHGVGSSSDLPLPLDLVLQAGAATVVLSFLIAALWWTRPRLAGFAERPVPAAIWLPALRVVVLLLSLYLVGNALFGPRDSANPVAHALFVWLWVGVVPLSALLGPVWRAVNPLRTLFRLLRLPPAGLRPGAGLGVWPAVLWLLAFVWFELVAPGRTDPLVIGCCLLGYGLAQLGMAVLRGEQWFARGDCFELYSELAGRLSPLRWQVPLSGLAARLPGAGAGLAAFVAVWWGSTVFDSASGSPAWAGFVQRAGHADLYATGALVLVCIVVLVAVRKTAGGLDVTASLIPIAVGYTLAHYLSLLIVAAPRGFLLLTRQWGLASDVAWNVVPIPSVIAGAQVALILLGHVIGVIVAHDAALASAAVDAPGVSGAVRVAAAGPRLARGVPVLATLADELPLVLFMIGCTWAGLFLLFVR
ncbi:hypothetical protein [Actinoplanes siamensis]|uniref:Uncharacterized protein n=1 Tax=Actinoplanes siamensis TaxID=1223317 RepID=A0A919N3Z6_9ACTN|nr:hypothetical protein [Actinoplanes siamensis]GIF03977.1 hypothetical protein Asi03nite_15150 [Actinoplanes siamensis]